MSSVLQTPKVISNHIRNRQLRDNFYLVLDNVDFTQIIIEDFIKTLVLHFCHNAFKVLLNIQLKKTEFLLSLF